MASQEYEFHEIADAFPLLKDTNSEAFAELVEDIKLQGQLNEIVLFEGKILDGRNRYQACIEAEKEPRFKHYKDDDPIGFVISQNLKRRQMTKSQCEAAAAELANMIKGGDNQYTKVVSSNEPTKPTRISQADAAKKMGVSVAQVKRAAKVKNEDQEIFKEIKSGKITTSAAEKKVRAKTSKPRTGPQPVEQDADNWPATEKELFRGVKLIQNVVVQIEKTEASELHRRSLQQSVDTLNSCLKRMRQWLIK